MEIKSWDTATASSKFVGDSALAASFSNIPHVTSEGELRVEPSSTVVLVAEVPMRAHSFLHGGFRRSFHRLFDGFRAEPAHPFPRMRSLNLRDVGLGAFLVQSTTLALCLLHGDFANGFLRFEFLSKFVHRFDGHDIRQDFLFFNSLLLLLLI